MIRKIRLRRQQRDISFAIFYHFGAKQNFASIPKRKQKFKENLIIDIFNLQVPLIIYGIDVQLFLSSNTEQGCCLILTPMLLV